MRKRTANKEKKEKGAKQNKTWEKIIRNSTKRDALFKIYKKWINEKNGGFRRVWRKKECRDKNKKTLFMKMFTGKTRWFNKFFRSQFDQLS